MRLAAQRNAFAILGDVRNIGAQLRGGIRAETGLQFRWGALIGRVRLIGWANTDLGCACTG